MSPPYWAFVALSCFADQPVGSLRVLAGCLDPRLASAFVWPCAGAGAPRGRPPAPRTALAARSSVGIPEMFSAVHSTQISSRNGAGNDASGFDGPCAGARALPGRLSAPRTALTAGPSVGLREGSSELFTALTTTCGSPVVGGARAAVMAQGMYTAGAACANEQPAPESADLLPSLTTHWCTMSAI